MSSETLAVRFRWRAVLALALAGTGLLAGCASQRIEQALVTPEQIVEVPNGEFPTLRHLLCVRVERAALGPAGERIAYAVMPPRPYDIDVRVERTGPRKLHLDIAIPKTCPTGTLPPRGTVVLLHGYGMDMSAWSLWAARLGRAGYTVLLVDLPGFGASRDYRPGYGAREAEGVARLVEHLRADGRLPAPLSVFGVSLGGMEALRLGALVPDVRGVIALAPLYDLEASTWSTLSTDAPWWLRWWVSRDDLDIALRRAETRLDTPLRGVRHEDAVVGSRACTLLLRGATDVVVSQADIGVYAARLPAAQVYPLPGVGHVEPLIRIDWLGPAVLAWLNGLGVPPGPCPVFALPADPLAVVESGSGALPVPSTVSSEKP